RGVGLPCYSGRSAPALPVSRPARRSRTLRPAGSPSRPRRPSASKASAASLPPLPLRLLPAGAKVAGWDLHPLKNCAFARRTEYASYLAARAEELRNDPIDALIVT